MPIYLDKDHVRLTKGEVNALRSAAARQGIAINNITTGSELLEAVICSLDTDVAEDMLQFLETGTSPMYEAGQTEQKRD
jgi:hypothetical protein